MSANSFFPVAGPVTGVFGGGALAILGTGSVALVNVHVWTGRSVRQPLTATIGAFSAAV